MTVRAPRVTSCSWPWTRVMPAGRPESSFVAKFPRVATTFGSMSSIWRKRCGSQAAISSGSGSRFPGGLHLRTFATKTSAREADALEQPVEQLPRLPDERHALLVLVEPGRLADEHQVGIRAPRAEDDLRSPAGERAPRARGRLLRVLPERRCALDGFLHRALSLRGCPDAPARHSGLVAAAAGAAAATARAGCSREPPRSPSRAVHGERRELLEHVAGAALGAHDGLLGRTDELLEVRLALHARVLVDRHARVYCRCRWSGGRARARRPRRPARAARARARGSTLGGVARPAYAGAG